MKYSRKLIFLVVLMGVIVAGLLLLSQFNSPSRPLYQRPLHDKPQVLFSASVNVETIETTADALTTWRDFSDVRPALLIFSNKPLMPPPSLVRAELSELLAVAGRDEVRMRTARPSEPDTLLRPEMAVASGLLEGYFSRVIWVVSPEEGSKLQLEGFVTHFRRRAEKWGENLDTFHLEDGHIVGTLAGTRVDVVTVDQLPVLTEPLLLHFDVSYLLPLYKGEIKTPIYRLLRQQCKKIADMNYLAWRASVSRDNLTGDMPLDTRFFADELARFIAQPVLLGQATQDELLRTEALYLVNFLENERIYEDYQRLKELRPLDASVLFGEYKVLRDLRQPDQALRSLEQAVSLDAIYAYEYNALADQAMEKKFVDKALQQLDKAIAALPREPFVRMRKARLLMSLGRDEEARAILEELRKLPWSSNYYTEVRTEIERLL